MILRCVYVCVRVHIHVGEMRIRETDARSAAGDSDNSGGDISRLSWVPMRGFFLDE